MKVVIDKSFKIDMPTNEDKQKLKSCAISFKEIDDEIEINDQKITLEEEKMEKVLDIFAEYGFCGINLERYDSERYTLITK